MHGPVQRLIQSQGSAYNVMNATGGGGRDTPSYSFDVQLVGVLERRGRPRTVTDSSGTEIGADLEIRTVPVDGTTLREAGSADGYPTKLVGGRAGKTYRVLHKHVEDGGVTVLTVVED